MLVSLSFWDWYFEASIDVARVEKNIKDNMTIFVAIVDWTSKANKQAFRSEWTCLCDVVNCGFMGWVLFIEREREREREYPHARRFLNWLVVSVVSYRMVFLWAYNSYIVAEQFCVNPNDIAVHALMHFPGNAGTNHYIKCRKLFLNSWRL